MDIKEFFKSYPKEEPSYNGCNYLTIIDVNGCACYAITYFNKEAKFEPKHGKVVAFTERNPRDVLNKLV